ncbi:MAG: Zn-dependent hydrolase [Myxococcales bacterium]|nr:Zn-dependent hydrolase [Myxococcales bacterium]MCB9749673.1 Zn-dependent hydrolase [Myxococcales bacterium]
MGTPLAINGERLLSSVHALAELGAYVDERTGLVGVNRLALTDADRAGRERVKGWFEAAGLEVRVDRVGNVYGRRAGAEALAPVIAGSHIDSVPTGGRYDGALGVLAALEVVRTLNDRGVTTRRPLEIAFFTDEEGARFGTDMLGSAVACGRIPLADAYALTDETGVTVRDELARIGFLGEHDERVSPPRAYVELHIEQGPVLADAGLELGVVTGVQAISWLELTLVGKFAHAGTTPMTLRRDAGLVAARVNVRLHEMATSGRYGAQMRATMGRVKPVPNRVNIVPGRVICTVDLRNPEDDAMAAAEAELTAFLEELSKQSGVSIAVKQTAKTARVRFDAGVQSIIAGHARAAGLSHAPIQSGAGHDAQEFAAICPTGMIFVPGEFDGISHNPRERSTPESCIHGANILLRTLLELADAA